MSRVKVKKIATSSEGAMAKQLKHLKLPTELINRIQDKQGYWDFTSKVILLLEKALELEESATEGSKKKVPRPSQAHSSKTSG